MTVYNNCEERTSQQQKDALQHVDSLSDDRVQIIVDEVDDENGCIKDLRIHSWSVLELPREFHLLFHHVESLWLSSCPYLTNVSLISRMRYLRSLKFYGCNRLCQIPVGLPRNGGVAGLRQLSLSGCPAFDYSLNLPNLHGLEDLSLDDVSLRRFPLEIWSLSNHLKALRLECPLLNDGFPAEFGHSIKTLELYGCRDFDYSSLKMPNLQSLEGLMIDLKDEQFEEAPKEIWSRVNLKKLLLEGNGLKRVPDEIANLRFLEQLVIRGESISSVSCEIGKLVNLESLTFAYPDLTQFPVEMGQLRSLKKICLYECQALEKLPPVVLQLPNLECLELWICYNLSIPVHHVLNCSDSLVMFDCGDDEEFQGWCAWDNQYVDVCPDDLKHVHNLFRCMVRVNRAGRRLLKEKDRPLALWTRILGRCSADVDSIFFFLKQLHEGFLPPSNS